MTILIDVAAEFTGKKAFSNAEKATQKLEKSAQSLGRTLTRTLSTAAILAYSKASIKAAAADLNAQKQLALALNNVGLGRDAATSEGYIQRLQTEFGVVDDKLRPAYQILAVATRDTAESQRLMGIAMDVSAANGLDLQAVSKALSKAYLGNNTALSKLGVGISKADLKTKSFKEITDQLSVTFAGSATAAASGYQGSIDKLAVAANNAKEIIGTGLLDALTAIGGTGSSAGAASGIEKLATGIADTLKNVGELIDKLKELKPLFVVIGIAVAAAFAPITTAVVGTIFLLGQLNKLLDKSLFKQGIVPGGMGNISMSVNGQVSTAKAITKQTQAQATAQAKITKEKKSQAILDKANLALNKGNDLFNMDAIQLQAAMINQTEQLGKVTSQAQLLAITNDMIRIKIKQDILALEDAIASKDEARITAATNQLNKDLLIYNALTNQNLKLADIKSILDSIVPKDLINQKNLDEALRKIMEMMKLLDSMGKTGTTGTTTTTTSPKLVSTQVPEFLTLPKIDKLTGKESIDAILEFSSSVTELANVMADMQDAQNYAAFLSLIDFQRQTGDFGGYSTGMNRGGAPVTITVNTGVGDPNAIAEAVNQVIQDAVDRGTLRGGTY